MKTYLTAVISFITLFASSFNSSANESNHPERFTPSFIEIIAEADDTSELYGFHFISYSKIKSKSLRPYVGIGLVHVNLLEADDSFTALHAVGGSDLMITKNLGLTAEFGFDLGEELISGEDERGNPVVGGNENNQVDFNFSVGLVFKLQNQLYLKAYVRRHYFDGVFLPDTNITFIGARLGLSF